MYNKKDVGELITVLRLEKGITSQAALADLSGVAQSTVREIELGNSSPKMETLAKICEVLDLTLLEFYFRLEGPKNALLVDGLNPDNKRNLSAIANTMKNNQKLPQDTRGGSSGLTDIDKDGNKPKFKGQKKRQTGT